MKHLLKKLKNNILDTLGLIRVLARLFVLAGKQIKWNTFFYILIILIISVIPFISTFINSKLVDEISGAITSGNKDYGIFITIAIAYLITQIIFSLMDNLLDMVENRSYLFTGRFFEHIFSQKAVTLDLPHYEDKETVNLIHKAKDIFDWRPREVFNNIFHILMKSIRLIFSLVAVALFSWQSVVLIIITTIPKLITGLFLGQLNWGIWVADIELKSKYYESRHTATSEDNLSSIKAFRLGDYFINMATQIYEVFFKKEVKLLFKKTKWEVVTNLIGVVGVFGYWVMLLNSALNGNITLGDMLFFLSSVSIFQSSIVDFVNELSKILVEARFIKDYFAFLDLKPKITVGTEDVEEFDIKLNNVQFSYPETEKKIFEGLNLEIKNGEKVAIVGVNGSGKSTLIKLLTKAYEVTGGEINLGGKNVLNISEDSFYKKICCLYQNNLNLRFLTVKENVSVGNVDIPIDETRVVEALEKADAMDFINEYPKKLNQILDKVYEGGIEPSGGQWQKIAIARALYKNADILILDEATSAIDAEAEEKIFNNIYDSVSGKTVIIISHRFSTVRRADRIVVLEDGKIIEDGKHEELMALEGAYARAFNIQAKGYI